MKNRHKFYCRLFVYMSIFCITVPVFVLAIWSVAGRWAWPNLLPQIISLRGIKEIFEGNGLLILHSSIMLSLTVAFVSTIIGIMTARAIVFYNFKGKSILKFSSLLPLIVPTTVFGMGIHILFIYVGLSDTILGVVIVHTICALPYTVNIMTESTKVIGNKLEEQARVLGAGSIYAFFKITIPALVPSAVTAGAMAYITSFSQYFLTLLIGGGNVKTFTLIMVPFLQNGDRTIACAYSVLFLSITLVVFYVANCIIKKLYVVEQDKLR